MFNCNISKAQKTKSDSLLKIIHTTKNDSIKIGCILSLAELYSYQNPNKALKYTIIAKEFSFITNNKIQYAKSLRETGWYYYKLGNYSDALKNYFDALKVYSKNEIKYTSATLSNIGDIYLEQKDYEKAKEYYNKALLIDEKSNNLNGIATLLGNVGIVSMEQGEYKKALDYYFKSITINKLLLKKAIRNKNEEEINKNKAEVSIKLGNIGYLFLCKSDAPDISNFEKTELLKQSFECFTDGLKIDYELNRKYGIAAKLGNLGILYLKTKKYDKSEKYLQNAILISDSINALDLTSEWHNYLSQLFTQTHQIEKAFEEYKIYVDLKNKINSLNSVKLSSKIELNYEFEKEIALKKAEQEKKDAIAKAEKRKQQIIIISTIMGLLLLIVFTAFVLYSLKLTKKQKIIIEQQKQIVEEKQKEIIDSINYAKRLQNAILPSKKLWQKYLPNSFILYQPKDIVAGDFYWLEIKNNEIIFAVADCTGHGVPGAMVSVVCSNSLNRVVNEFNITEPGKILDKTKELVVEHFTKGGDDVKDGMDISICSLCYENNKITLKWAGANNPLWIISSVILNDSEESKVEDSTKQGLTDVLTNHHSFILNEFKPDKQPIGKTDNNVQFKTHIIELQKNDMIYIFSDGFQDQFGGELGKKYKASKMKELLLSITNNTIIEQEKIIANNFKLWKGNLEQVDDVCIIGIKI